MNAAAFDIGTTTLAAALSVNGKTCRIELPNPQSEIGGRDVISRIRCASKPENRERLTRIIREQIRSAVLALCRQAGISACDIDSAALCGNTAMTGIFAGADISSLGSYPYKVGDLFGYEGLFPDTGLSCGIYLFPSVSAFVGGDVTAGGIILPKSDGPRLLADLGTNGELLLVTGQGSFAASAAAGPAFEGASLECGSPAITGAVSRILSDGGVEVIGGGEAKSLCGSGVISALAYLLNEGLLDSCGVLRGDGIPLDRRAYLSASVYLSGGDIREILTAKAAVNAAAAALLRRAGLAPDDCGVYISGSFGRYLDVFAAERIGLLPAGMCKRAKPLGNSALDGALAVAENPSLRQTAEALAAETETIILSDDSEFEREFIENMVF